MLSRGYFVIALLGSLLTAGGCTTASGGDNKRGQTVAVQSTQADVSAIVQLYADWRDAVETADIDSYVAVLHPDVRMLPPGADAVVGSGSYAAFLEPVFAAADYKIEVLQMPQITIHGDLAVSEYEYVIHLDLKNPNQGVNEPGALTASRSQTRYFDVLHRTAEGGWGVWRHTWREAPAGN